MKVRAPRYKLDCFATKSEKLVEREVKSFPLFYSYLLVGSFSYIKAEFHPNVELPLVVLLPPSGATFATFRGRGERIPVFNRHPVPTSGSLGHGYLRHHWGSLFLLLTSLAIGPVEERGAEPHAYAVRFPV